WCTYTDPEIAHVGLYERDARERGVEVDTYVREFKEVDRAVLDGEEDGFVKFHVRKGHDEILGATIVARHAGEMISEISVAMAAEAEFRFILLNEPEKGRVNIQLICDARIKPIETVEADEVELAND